MIQLQALNYILSKNDIEFLNLYDKRYYFVYEKEYEFIKNHYIDEHKLPDIPTVLDHCKDFEVMTVTESKKYLQDTLFEEYLFESCSKLINASEKGFAKNAVKAKEELIAKLQAIKPPLMTYGEDIIKTAQTRYDHLIDRMADESKYVFSTGLQELDIILNGGLRRGEELLVIYARTNNAKTWIAEKILVSIWAAGNNVGFFSPEMSSISIGYRFDTLFKNFDNKGIMGEIKDFNTDNYKQYINGLIKKEHAIFSVTNPMDFPDKRVTVSAIKNWITALDLKAIVIDGLSYMTNERSYIKKSTTENLTEICEDLIIASTELGIPIIAVLQANREGARDKDGEVSTEAPELDTIRGSDGISHNATRCISLYKAKDIIKLYLNKNRYGEKGQHLYYQYNVNEGIFTYVPNPKDGLPFDTSNDDANNFDDTASPF